MKSIIDLESRLDREQARKVLSELLNTVPNCFSYGAHFRNRMAERDMTIGDVLNILHKGKILKNGEFENGQWRYRVETEKMAVVIAFNNPFFVRGVTCWRGKHP